MKETKFASHEDDNAPNVTVKNLDVDNSLEEDSWSCFSVFQSIKWRQLVVEIILVVKTMELWTSMVSKWKTLNAKNTRNKGLLRTEV